MASGGAFVVMDIQSGNIIGSSRYYDYEPQRREVAIGYTFLATEYWGRGYNHEMKTLMLAHAFRFVDRVLFQVGANNLRSQRALQKLGSSTFNTQADLVRRFDVSIVPSLSLSNVVGTPSTMAFLPGWTE
jgi:RimJ/RimL family protein N-acetyltransferase